MDTEEFIVGLTLIIALIIMIGMSGLSGRLSNIINPRLISGVAMMFICASSAYFSSLITYHLTHSCCMCLQGIGNGLFSAPNNKYVLTPMEEKDLPNASSVLSTSKEFCEILSAGIFTFNIINICWKSGFRTRTY